MAMRLCGQPFDQAWCAIGQRDNPAAFGMDFMNSAERFAVEVLHPCVAQVR